MDMSRRGFMELAGSTLILGTNGGVEPQVEPPDMNGDADLYGLVLDTTRPSKAQIDADWDTYRLVHLNPATGEKAHIDHTKANWQDIPMTVPTTQVDEVRTENFESFFNLTFARPEAPDDKNWAYTDADVTKDISEIELASTTSLESTQRGNYPAGSEAIPGVAWRVTGTPTAGSAEAGYFDGQDGGGVGEDATDSYVFLRKAGTTKQVYRENWNGYRPSERLWVSDRPVITRMPHLFYGGGDFQIRALVHGEQRSELKTLHTFTPDNVSDTFGAGPPFNQPNLPVSFQSSNLSGGSVRANAAHYEFGEVETETRVNGEHFTNVSVATTGWTPLLIWQKRPGWDAVNVKPLQITTTAESNDIKLGLQLNPSLSSKTTTLPENTSSDETAVEVVDATVDATGERRWVGYASAGQGNKAGSVASEDLTFNLPTNQEVALVGQAVGSAATASGAVAWEEYF